MVAVRYDQTYLIEYRRTTKKIRVEPFFGNREPNRAVMYFAIGVGKIITLGVGG